MIHIIIKGERIKYLVELLNNACFTYYTLAQPIMSDKEFDLLYEELEMLEKKLDFVLCNSPTQKVNYEMIDEFKKVKHTIPLISLKKEKTIKGVEEFIKGKESYASLKIDGLTTNIKYNNGILIEASTRGQEDITHNIKTYKNVPLVIPFKGYLEIAGESYIHLNDFEEINEGLPENEKYKTARNLASGSVKNLDSRKCAERKLHFRAFKISVVEDMKYTTKTQQLEWLLELGFQTVPSMIITNGIFAIEKCIDEIKIIAENRGIGYDGVVIQYNDIAYSESLGKTSKYPLDAIAFKFQDDVYETELIDIIWQTSRTGLINPTAIFKSIEIDGTMVERATLHNLDYVKKLQLGIGDTLVVSKRGSIIPKIEDNLTRSNTIKMPLHCPDCGSKTSIKLLKETTVLICTNENCFGKLVDKINHFASKDALNIKGLSDATISKFVEEGFIIEFVDLYNLQQHEEEIIWLEGFGDKSYQKLIKAVEKSKDTELYRLIYGLGINHVGLTTAKKLCNYYDNNMEYIINAKSRELLDIEDIGIETAQSIEKYFNDKEKLKQVQILLSKYLKIKNDKNTTKNESNVNSRIEGMIFTITGTLSQPRKYFEDLITTNGGVFSKGFNKKVNFVIVGEKPGNTLKKAQESKNSIIINEQQFMDML